MANVASQASLLPLSVLALALETGGSGVVVTDPEHRVLYANESFLELSGYSLSELVGRNLRVLRSPEADPQAVAAVREALGAGRAVRQRLLNQDREGFPFWVDMHINPLIEGGRITHWVGVQQDITSLVALEASLEEHGNTDLVTGLQNGRAFSEGLDAEHSRSARYGLTYSVVLLDVDVLGEGGGPGTVSGDAILRGLSTILLTGRRRSDGVYRLSNERFAMVLPHTDAAGADWVMEMVTRAIAKLTVGGLKLSVRFGGATFPTHGGGPEELTDVATDRLELGPLAWR